jgi:hypothetical protein
MMETTIISKAEIMLFFIFTLPFKQFLFLEDKYNPISPISSIVQMDDSLIIKRMIAHKKTAPRKRGAVFGRKPFDRFLK